MANLAEKLSQYLTEEIEFCDKMMKQSVAQNNTVAWMERKDAMIDVLEHVNELIQEESVESGA